MVKLNISQSVYVPQLAIPTTPKISSNNVHVEKTSNGLNEAIKLTISTEAKELYQNSLLQKQQTEQTNETNDLQNNQKEEKQAERSNASERTFEESQAGVRELSAQEQLQVRKLEQRDQEVRMHEQAHIAASGGISVSAANFTYQTGPDGQRYAIGGEVNFRTPASSDPKQALQTAHQLQQMALAPANPSSTDRSVAAKAAQDAARARMQIQQETMEEYREQLHEEDNTTEQSSTEQPFNNNLQNNTDQQTSNKNQSAEL